MTTAISKKIDTDVTRPAQKFARSDLRTLYLQRGEETVVFAFLNARRESHG